MIAKNGYELHTKFDVIIQTANKIFVSEDCVKEIKMFLEKTTALSYNLYLQNIINNLPSMIIYGNQAGSKGLAVFNGTVWNFWKATPN